MAKLTANRKANIISQSFAKNVSPSWLPFSVIDPKIILLTKKLLYPINLTALSYPT
jgi:hypothetical protein